MSYTDFERQLLVAAYLVADDSGDDLINARDVFQRFDIFRKRGWLGRAIESFVSRGWATDTRTIGTEEDYDIYLNAAGFRKAEELENYVQLTEKSGNANPIPSDRIASINWEQVNARLSTPASIKEIKAKALDLRLTIEQSDLDERSKANALKRTDAVLQLVEAPDPPWETVVDLLNNRYFSAMLNALAILQIVTGLVL